MFACLLLSSERRRGFMGRQQRNVWFFCMSVIPLTLLAMQKVDFSVRRLLLPVSQNNLASKSLPPGDFSG